MEGNTYPARWKKQGERFLVYLDQDKNLKGIDFDFETACEELCLNICEKYGDGEAVLNFLRSPPEPSGASKYAHPALVTLGWNESACGEKWQNGLFEGGYCDVCRAGIGNRTRIPLVVETLPKGNIGDFDQIMYSPVLLSEEFLSCFSDPEKNGLGLQEVVAPRNKKRRFFEITGDPLFRQVGVKGGNYNDLSSWECSSCGYKSFSCSHPEMPDNYKYMNFCANSDLPNDINEIFIIEDNVARKMICMSLKRWNQMSHLKQTKGVSADRLFVLPDEQVERNPTGRVESNIN